MHKIKQRIYEFGQIFNGIIITQDTCIENVKSQKTIPIIFKDKIIGQCVIETDNNGIICNGIIYDDNIINDKLQIGTFLMTIKEQYMENNLAILDNIDIKNIVK